MLLYVSFDGDHIGRMVGKARLADKVEEVRRVGQAIDAGNRVMKSWAEYKGGSVIELGGDEGALEVPADCIGELPAIKAQYESAVGATLSIGVGMRLSESAKALVAAKLQGGDRIVFFTDEVNELVAKAAEQGQKTEEQKIADEYLNKADPAMNEGDGAGFSGATRPIAPQPEQKPVATQGEHSEAHDLYDLLDGAPAPAEVTHAAHDFERQLHDEAWKGEEEDMQGAAEQHSGIEQVKAQVVEALQTLKAQAPILEQVKSVAPGAYKAMMQLAQSVIGLAKQLTPAQPMQKSEGKKDKIADMVDAVRNAHKDESRGTVDLEHCQKGDCYEQCDALYHLLGGQESGFVPHHLFHGTFGPHWFLKGKDGRILDPMADTHHEPLPYHQGLPSNFLTDHPSEGAMEVINKVLGFEEPKEAAKKAELKTEAEPHDAPKDGEELEKAKLPMPKAPTRHNVVLPVGSQVDNKVKVQHQDGTSSWKQMEAGQIRSMDPAGHPTSSRSPNSR